MLLGFSWQTWALLAQFSVLPDAVAPLYEHAYTFAAEKNPSPFREYVLIAG